MNIDEGAANDNLNRRTVLTGATALTAGAIAEAIPTSSAMAAAPPSGMQAPGYYRYKIGDVEITVINDGVWLPDIGPNSSATSRLRMLGKR